MSAVAEAPADDGFDLEQAKIVHWHEEQMEKLGIPPHQATLLAFDGVDWHDAYVLIVLQKCPVDLAYDILR